MRAIHTLLLILVLFSTLGACSQVPEPASYLYSKQEKVQAVHHWDLMARDVAQHINKIFPTAHSGKNTHSIKAIDETRPFYIENREETTFGKSFHNLLESNMVALGLPVSVKATPQALTVNYNVIGVNYEANRNTRQTKTIIGKVFRRSIIALRDILSLGAFPEQGVPHSEVIVTVTIAEANQYLMQNTFIYYINDPDFWHYEKSVPSKIKLKSTNQ